MAAGITGAVLVALLHLKDELHGFLARVREFELTAAIKLLLVSVVLLPVLPDQGYGPGGVLNPHLLWWAVVVISTIGFAGYAAMRIAGVGRGALLMGFLGGLVSSTSLTVSAARASKAGPGASLALAGAVATAQAVMFVRTGLFVVSLNAQLFEFVVVPLACGAVVAIGAAAAMTWRGGGSSGDAALSPGSPDMLNAAMQFVLVAAVVMVLAHYVYIYAGGAGIIASGLLSGAIDVDAATLSASRLANAGAGGANLQAAGISVGAAIVANTMVKAGIAYAQGSREMAKAAIAALAASGVATCLGLAIAVWLT
ncbi:MAG: DUF4010 domain-containing protein [Micropepsaceae bacterium]